MNWRWAGLIIAFLATPAPVLAGSGQHAAIIDAVSADDLSGNVLIRYRGGTTITAPKGRDQKSLSRPALAEDRRTAGWLGNYDSCCQSYPIPRQLVIWKSGRTIRRFDAGAMIWNWRFYDRGREVGFSDGPTHGTDIPYSYKLYDVPTGRLVGEIDGHQENFPEWAKLLLPEAGK
jgi:hypothetical protein